jgi:TolB-like protein/class 3 adenylate cyclase
MAVDVVGYSRLMGRDESGTLQRLREHRKQRLEPTLARHGGRLVKLTGDGALVEFASAVDALSAAIEFQQAMIEADRDQPADTALVFRIGLHLGDLIVDGDDLYGDGVNVAARLEGEAPAGGILISRNVRDAVAGRVKATFEDLGGLSLKNIERPVRTFRVGWDPNEWPDEPTKSDVVRASGLTSPSLALPDKPSIAVLPFQNMSGDSQQDYFADGIVEDIITALSRFKSLFVIARNSSFTYKGKAVNIKQVGRELGVRYVLEGSVRNAGGKVRITGQLIDSETEAHLWADRFDGSMEDVFELQDDVTRRVVEAIAPRVEQAEIARVKRRRPDNTHAYDCYLRGLACLSPVTIDSLAQALRLFTEASVLDPEFSPAYGMAMCCHGHRVGFGLVENMEQEKAEVARLWRMVARVGHDDSVALGQAGFAIAFVYRDLPSAKELIDRAVELNPNLASAWGSSGWINLWQGHPIIALDHLARADRLDPGQAGYATWRSAMVHAHFFLGQYDEALALAEQMLLHSPNAHPVLRIGTASAAFGDRPDVVHRLAARLKDIDPAFRVSRLREYLGPYQKPEFVEKYQEALRRAGLPE